jgi:hypothetical protein
MDGVTKADSLRHSGQQPNIPSGTHANNGLHPTKQYLEQQGDPLAEAQLLHYSRFHADICTIGTTAFRAKMAKL